MVLPRPTSSASSHRTGSLRTRALGDVELVREEPDASAEEGAQAIGFAKGQEVQDVEARHEILDLIEIAQRESFEQRAFELQRPQRVRDARPPVRELQRSRPGGAP